MARDRRTLALIIILPILATVITAFRIRDLPKSQDVKKCEHCDVKVGQKVHSAKIESDKPKLDELKKTVRDKQQLINEKIASASKHKFDVKSDEDDEDSELPFSKIKPGLKQEILKDNKIDKSVNVKPTASPTKSSFGLFGINDESDEDDEINKAALKPKTIEIKKLTPEKSKQNVIKSSPKVEVNKQKSKLTKELSIDDGDDDDDDDDSDDNSYEGLENVDELFKILDIKKKPSTKISKDEPKAKIPIEVKTPQNDLNLKVNVKSKDDDDSGDDDNDDDDDGDVNDDDDDDDDEDNDSDAGKKIKERELKIIITKPLPPPKDLKDKNEPNLKKPVVKEEKYTVKQEKKVEPKPVVLKDLKEKVLDVTKKSESKAEKPEIKADDKSQTSKEKTASKPLPEVKKSEIKKVEENKPTDPVKKTEPISQKHGNQKSIQKEKPQADAIEKPKKEEKKEESPKIVLEPKISSTKLSKEVEKDNSKSKSQEKVDKIGNEDKKIDKKPEPKKETATEHKKDIKYDFEKPNAYKDSHKAFDYSEFEKIQVTKPRHKEKKPEKTSAEKSDSREERYLKQVTDALNRRNLLKSEFEDFYAFFPTFAPNFSRIHNPECRRHGQILLRQLRGTKLWALNMLDATAKIPSGVLQGNGIQLGDFDQCLGSKARVQLDTGSVVKVQGKYCLARIDVKAEHSELEGAVYLAQAKSLIRSKIDDPGHFVPRFSTLSWGVCVPSACDREDVEVIIKDAVKHYQHKSGLVLKVKVDEEDCHTDDGDDWDEWLELPTVLTLSFYGVVLLLVLVATIQDFLTRRPSDDSESDEQAQDESNGEPKQADGIFSQFSLYRSISKLIAPGSTDEIACIHGVRGVATLALLVAHKFMPVGVMPYTNRLRITEIASSRFWSWCRSGWIFTDCFLLLSGTLTSHRISDDTSTVRRIFSRYIRLTPALLAVVLFYAYIWDKLSTGPMWGSFVTKNAEVCQEGWWWNLLYVQNYFGLEEMCAPQTHQLALDMQLTILGTIILLVVQSGQGFTKLLLPAIHLVAAYFRYTTVRDHRLTLLAYHGVSVSQLYRTARLSYMSTLHRCSPYLIGLSLGIALKKPSKHGKFLLTLGWVTSLGLWTLVFWAGMDSGSTQYKYNASFAAQYATIAPIASAMAIAWLIYAVHSGTCDFLSRALCFRPLVFISRISYALYLCQFIIFITNIGTVRTSTEFCLMSLIDVQEISALLLSSTILTVTFVIPMQSLHKLFSLESKSPEPEESLKPEESPEKERKKSVTIEEPEKKDITPPLRRHLVAHREVLEEIPEAEIEYDTQRENTEGLEEIVEEEEGTVADEDIEIDPDMDDLEIIEEEEAGEDSWQERGEEREGERSISRNEDIDEWEWTVNGSGRSGAQYYRYAR